MKYSFKKWAFSLAMVLFGMAAIAQTRIISHVTNPGGGFSTTVIIENQSVVSSPYTLQAYDATGNPLTPLRGDIDGLSVVSSPVPDFFAEGAQVSHFEITAEDDVRISVAYNFELGNGSPAHVRDSSEQARGWRVFPGEWSLVFDGLALVNRGSVPTDIEIVQKDYQGNVLNTQTIATGLAPNAKALFVIGSPDGSSFSLETPSYFEVTGTEPLSITALRGTLGREDVGLLWANRALPLSE